MGWERKKKVAALANQSHLFSPVLLGGKRKKRPEFYLSGNPFDCDCDLEWLQQINEISLSGEHPYVADLDDVSCASVGGSNLSDPAAAAAAVPIGRVKRHDFLCSYKTHCFPTCMCCEFYACDCRMHCPKGCGCYHDSAWSTNVIRCSHNQAERGSDVPLLIPMDATHIHLDGNDLGDVDSQSFIGRRRVHALYLNVSRVTSISRQTLSGLVSLQVLHLEDNLLKEIAGHEFATLSSLRELYLQNNQLAHIAANAFDSLTALTVLRLDGNLLTTFPAWQLMTSMRHLASLTLADNPGSCQCDFLLPFKRFLLAQQQRVADADKIVCMGDDDNLANLVDFRAENLTCHDDSSNNKALVQQVVPGGDSFRQDLITILVSSSLALVVVLSLCLAACLFRSKIKRWLHNKSSDIYDSRCGSSSVHSGLGGGGSLVYANGANNRLFDVYISYSNKDADFVDQSLAPSLESGATAYKLCLHQRDFPPSATLEDTVAVATESSSRVVLVLSRAYLESEWPHVKIPLRNALGAAACGKLVLLYLDDIPEEEVGSRYPELGQYAKACASVRWGTPGFLNKLRFFLPEPAFLTFQRNVTLRTLHQPTLLKSPLPHPTSVMQVDRVSGVWTYTLGQQHEQQQQQQL